MTRHFNYSSLPEFDKEFERLKKKYRTLDDDLNVFKCNQIKLTHDLKIDNKGVFPISGIGIIEPKLYIAKKFACQSLKGKGSDTGIRIVYAYYEHESRIEWVEIYIKSEKDTENMDRLKKHYKKGKT